MAADNVVVRGLGGRIAEIVGAAHVTQAARELGTVGVTPGGAPAWLVRPGSAGEIAELVRLASAEGAAIVPVGTASRRPRRGEAARARIVVDTRRLAHVLHLDETSLTVQVQAGITGLALEELLLPRGLTLGDFPPAVLRSTIGGMLSVRTPGKVSPRHGLLEEAVLGVSAVMADGRTIHTRVAPRRATGPDLARVLLGAEGTLGVVTAATLRLHRRAEARLLDTHRLPDMAQAVAALYAALRADARPSGVRVYDAAEAHAHLGGELARGAEAILVVGTAGPPELASVDRDLFAEAARARGGTGLGPAPAELWWRRRYGHAGGGLAPPLPALEIFAAPPAIAPLHAAVIAAAGAAGRAARAHVARFDPDGACVFVTLTHEGTPDAHGPARAAVEQAAVAAGGHLIGSRDESLAPYSEALARALDPRGVFA